MSEGRRSDRAIERRTTRMKGEGREGRKRERRTVELMGNGEAAAAAAAAAAIVMADSPVFVPL
jgi:hypothetical protein